ncbi:MAG TPA: TlpA disulfide reductase family protein [Pyrinomonadaceae bacterium]|nr:TlpA disulfide reductase family protein [Pyrinomonadaceae bacterium]
MRFRLPILLVSLAVYLSFGFAALAQLPVSAAKPTGRALPVYLDWKTLKCRPAPTCTITRDGTLPPVFFCDHQVVDALPVAQPCIGFARSSSDIREIDLEGLKKILQRDPKDTRPLLVNFWATWCDPCREEFPDLVKLDADYPAKRLNFVAVSLDDIADIKTAVPKFLKEMNATMPVVLLNVNDPEPAIHAVDEKWDGQLPATFLFDKDGKVVFKHFGRIKPEELRSAIDKQVGTKQ